MYKFLSQPYPLTTSIKKRLKVNIFIGIFIGLFLIIFQPFGNSEWQTDYKIVKQAGYGFISFLMPTLMSFTLRIFKIPLTEEKWTTGKEILWLVGILLLIALGNIYYSNLLGISNLNLVEFVKSLIMVVVIGIFPIMAIIFLQFNKYKKLNEHEASEIGSAISKYNLDQINHPSNINIDGKIDLVTENNRDNLSIYSTDILYLESADNYTQIAYLNNHKIRKELLRGSLKSFELQIHHPNIVRCHRSYIVNLAKVLEITGNAQGYKLGISDGDKLVPVSRNYGKDILPLLKKL